jgi:putative ABC transport system permease protein
MTLGGGPPRRAVVRWSRRLVRRQWREQLLIVTLLTLAVGAGVTLASAAVNAASTGDGEFGDADVRIRLDADDTAALDVAIRDARARWGDVDVIAHTTTVVPGSVERLDVRDVDPHGEFTKPMLRVLEGRYPTDPGEVALTTRAAELLSVGVGEVVPIAETNSAVVGIVENPGALGDDFALVAPGSLTTPASYVLLVDSAREETSAPGSTGFDMEIKGNDNDQIAVTVLAASTLAMALVGLIAAAGFVVLAQRRQRQLGLLSAIGATDRHLRLTMVASGAIVGLVAGVLGIAIGLVGWIVVAPAVESAAAHRLDRADLPWSLIAAQGAISIVVATLAAWWPARVATRLPVVQALSGRPGPPRPVRRPLLLAAGLAAVGVVVIAIENPTQDPVSPAVFIAGLLAVVVGSVLAAPAAIRASSRVARRLPLAFRIAVRDLARYQARASAALAAITLALAISVGIIVVAAANQPESDEGNLSEHQLIVRYGDSGDRYSEVTPDQTAGEVADLDERAATVVAALGGGTRAVPLDVAFNPDAPASATLPRAPVMIGLIKGPDWIEGFGVAYAANTELLELLGIDEASVQPDTELLTERDEPFVLLDFGTRPDFQEPPVARQHVDLPSYGSTPTALLTGTAMQRHGWVAARAGWIVESNDPFTAEQIRRARDAAAEAGLTVEARSTEDGLAALRRGATVGGVLVALAIVAMAVGLIRGEASGDLRTLTATGAAPRTRRALTAGTAVGLVVPGVILGLAGAYVALVASYRSELGELVPIPTAQLTALVIGLPAIAATGGWLLGGREPRGVARRALD